ncbi:MAG: ferridoxin [Nitrospirae bacterium GWF2_44_13]|nr:MAG: ferridoxin [Nitrospirae bacterium GWF2_44_13]OGW63684.1 MAG: ferridoxin [Nitrospirae bacterium RIFOXYA2_FULL_44_9]OGW73892.1 MAG: ferridoxin [Nitrospirae bacterium RIFOXYC2_FULL_44_7]HBG92930.1 ferridoxin [Nitrospiraceae bacterium]
MSHFTIDKDKCKRDGICAAECPRRIIEFKKGQVPAPVKGAAQMCIRCGHCVAVCPHGAFSLSDMKPENCQPIRTDMALNVEQAEHFLRSRRSIRSYQDKEIEKEKIAKLIDIARYAPTGRNSQMVKWHVISSRKMVYSLAEMTIDWMRYMVKENNAIAASYRLEDVVKIWDTGHDIICRGAPGLVIAYAPKEYAAAHVDCTIALTFLDLAAPSFGLGTCWAGFFMMAASYWPPLQQSLSLPEGYACFGAMMIGYPKYKYQRLPLRKEPDITWYESKKK